MKDYNIHGNNWIMDRLWYTDRYLLRGQNSQNVLDMSCVPIVWHHAHSTANKHYLSSVAQWVKCPMHMFMFVTTFDRILFCCFRQKFVCSCLSQLLIWLCFVCR